MEAQVAPPTARRIEVAPAVSLAARSWDGDGGRPFVLVHGLASNAHLWDGVADRLAVLGHAVTTVDQRGHGQSDKPDSGYDFATVTDDLAALIGALGYERPVVAGQSWGGNVVLELAWRFPDLVSGIVCVDGGTIEIGDRFESWEACKKAMSPPPLAGRPAAEMEAMMRRFHPDWPESGIAAQMANFEVRADGTIAPWLTLDRHLQILHALWEHRPSTRYAELRVPVLLVTADGGDDAWTASKRKAVAAAEAAIPNVRTHWMVGDHDLHAQHPVEVADLLHAAVVDGFFG
jgi:pimeloyl-ACP methyl ester carboxylesterase